eukprot:c8201_g1_i1 orf=441-629(-)
MHARLAFSNLKVMVDSLIYIQSNLVVDCKMNLFFNASLISIFRDHCPYGCPLNILSKLSYHL